VLAVPDVGTPCGLRDRAMMELLLCTGIRRMELAGLAITDLDAQRGSLLVRSGKYRNDRLLPVGARALAWVQRYLQQSRPRLLGTADCGRLFVGHGGRPLSLNQLSTLMSQHVRSAGIGKRGSCHLFRHSMATLMLDGGADIRYIQVMLGHAQLGTTQIYTHVAIGRLQQVHAATHPAA
jgi:integrase/recombinase XerD